MSVYTRTQYMVAAFGQLSTPTHLQEICRLLLDLRSKDDRIALKASLTPDERKNVDRVFERMRFLRKTRGSLNQPAVYNGRYGGYIPTAFGFPIPLYENQPPKSAFVYHEEKSGVKYRSNVTSYPKRANDDDEDWDDFEENFLEFNDSNRDQAAASNNNNDLNRAEDEDDEKQIAKLMKATRLEESPYFAGNAGDILAWGRGIDGQLGSKKQEDSSVPVLVTALIHKDVVSVECGYAHTVALTHTGDVYAWGTSLHGQTGHNSVSFQQIPRLIEGIRGVNIRQISCGLNHTLALTDAGRVFSWGEGEFGQLGLKDIVQQQYPALIKTIDALKVVYINAGAQHSACITENGTLYTWGRNDTQQLGLGSDEHARNRFQIREDKFLSADTPQLVKGHPIEITLKNVTTVSCGQFHTACIADGYVYTWGDASRGRLGNGNEAQMVHMPRRIQGVEELKKFTDVQCGWDHTCAIAEDGVMWVWGDNSVGQLGLPPLREGSANYALLPTAVDVDALDRGWAQVRCSKQITVALSKNGDLYSWGRGASVLGHGDQYKQNQSTPPSVIEGLHTKQVLHIGLSPETCAVLASKKPLISVNLKALVNNEKFSDVKFKIEDHLIHGHQFILAARSKQFQGLFEKMAADSNSNNTNSNAHAIEIPINDPDFTYETFLALVEFLYTDFVDSLTIPVAEKLLPIAARYALPRLEAICKITIEDKQYSKDIKWIPRATLEEDLSHMFNSHAYHDIKFVIESTGQELFAHKALLYCRNSYFRSMFDSGMAEATKYATISVDVDFLVLHSVIEYLYSNKTKLSPAYILELFMLSHQYRINSLKYKCEHYISEHLDEDSVLPVLQIASVYNSKVLKNQSLDIIKKHYEAITNSEEFESVSEVLRNEIYRTCRPAVKQETVNPNSVIALLGDSNEEAYRIDDPYDSEEYYNTEDDYDRYEAPPREESSGLDLSAFVVTTSKKKKK